MGLIAGEWFIEAESEMIRDFNENAEGFITQEHYILAARTLGYSDKEARAMVLNAKAILVQDYPVFNLFRVLRSGNLEDMPAALQGTVMKPVLIDKCQLFCMCMGNTLPFSDHQINGIRMKLSEHYPDDFQYSKLSIASQSGPLIEFRNYDLYAGNQVDKLFETYQDWFNQKSEKLSPQFKIVKKQIKAWLGRKYGVNPPKKGFVEWLITQRLSSFAIKFDLEFKDHILVNGSKAKLTFSFQDKSQQFTNIERSIVEYCKLYKKELDIIDKELENSNLGEHSDENDAKSKSLLSTTNKQLTPEEMRKTVGDIMAPLGGNNLKKQKIMSDADFERLIDYTDYLVQEDKLPHNIKIIQQTQISGKHIRFTFYRLHKRLFTTSEIKGNFILMIHALFRQFENVQDSTTRTKFSEKPDSYFRDFGLPEEVI